MTVANNIVDSSADRTSQIKKADFNIAVPFWRVRPFVFCFEVRAKSLHSNVLHMKTLSIRSLANSRKHLRCQFFCPPFVHILSNCFTEGEKGEAHELEVLQAEGDADECYAEYHAPGKVSECYDKAAEEPPNHVHDSGEAA